MSSKAKALLVIGGLLALLAIGVVLIVAGSAFALRHVPAKAVLALEVFGPIPETAPEAPFGELFGASLVNRTDLRDALVRAADDERIRAVRVKVDDLAAGFATVQELRILLARVALAGKPTVAYLDTAGEFSSGNIEYYLASGCQRIVVGPIGDVNLTGLTARVPFMRGTLDKLGIEPEFPGIGEYKDARFMYTERDLSPAQREMYGWLLDSLRDQLVGGMAGSRQVSAEKAAALLAGGPYTAQEARDAGLVDEVADWSSFVAEVDALGGGNLEEISLRRYLRSGRPDESGPAVAVVVAEGEILRGESGYSPVPVFGGDVMGAETISRAFRAVRDSSARAVVFRINSPGGSVVGSEIIRAEMERTGAAIPVVVSMGDLAASGGYWIACGARRVFADPGTLTASIGVYGGHLAMSRFWGEKLGITWGRIAGDPNADIWGSLDPWTPEQRGIVEKFLERAYDNFLERVSTARKLPREQVDALGRGRVFTGAQAVERGLVDELGGFDEALAAAKELAGIRADATVSLEFYPRVVPLWQRILARETDSARLSKALRAVASGEFVVPGPVWLPPIRIE